MNDTLVARSGKFVPMGFVFSLDRFVCMIMLRLASSLGAFGSMSKWSDFENQQVSKPLE